MAENPDLTARTLGPGAVAFVEEAGESLAIRRPADSSGFLEPARADALERAIREETPWRTERIRMFGREIPIPRLTAWHGDPGCVYRYSGLTQTPLPWTGPLLELRERIRDETGQDFNGVLLNYYRNGHDHMSWHADDEPELGPDPLIASVSLGASRRFLIRHKDDPTRRLELLLDHGSLLVMGRGVQARWRHRVPPQKRVEAGRINLTFRRILGPVADESPEFRR